MGGEDVGETSGRKYGEPNIIAIIKLNRIRWAGHLAQIHPDGVLSVLFRNDPDCRRGVGRFRARWIDGVGRFKSAECEELADSDVGQNAMRSYSSTNNV